MVPTGSTPHGDAPVRADDSLHAAPASVPRSTGGRCRTADHASDVLDVTHPRMPDAVDPCRATRS